MLRIECHDPVAGNKPTSTNADLMRTAISIEVAEHVLQRFQQLNPEPIIPYRVISCPGKFPARRWTFRDMAQVLDDAQIQNGRMVISNPAYQLQQWLAAEAWMKSRWPKHHTVTVPARIVDRIDVDGLSLLDFLPRRCKRSKKS